MKKLNYLIIALVSVSVFLGSCKKKEEPNEFPMMTEVRINGISYANNDVVTFNAGDVLNIEVDATDDYGLVSVELAYQMHNYFTYFDSTYTTVDVSDLEATASFTYTLPQDMSSNEYVYLIFNIKDTDGEVSGFTITCNIAPDSIPYSILVSGAKIYNSAGTGMCAWDLENDVAVVFDVNNMPTGSDFNYIYQFNEYGVPDGFSRNILPFNVHSLKKLDSGFDFDNASEATVKAAYDLAPSNTPANVVVGDVIVQKYYAKDRYTVIKITDVVTTTSDNNDYFEFTYKKDLQ